MYAARKRRIRRLTFAKLRLSTPQRASNTQKRDDVDVDGGISAVFVYTFVSPATPLPPIVGYTVASERVRQGSESVARRKGLHGKSRERISADHSAKIDRGVRNVHVDL